MSEEVNGSVEITGSQMHRPLIVGLACLGATIAVAALGFLLGGTRAHAAEENPGALEKLVSKTTETVADVVEEVAAPLPPVTRAVTTTVNQVTKPVAKTVAAAPVVGPGAATAGGKAVDATTSTAAHLADSASAALASEAASRITRQIAGALDGLPLVGGVVGELSPALASAADGVDGILDALGSATRATVQPVTDIGLPSDPPAVDPPQIDPCEPPGGAPAPHASPTPRFSGADGADASSAWAGYASPNHIASLGDDQRSGSPPVYPPVSPPGPESTPPPASAGSGSAHGSAATIAADSPPSPGAGARLPAAGEQTPPASPVLDTDVSPD